MFRYLKHIIVLLLGLLLIVFLIWYAGPYLGFGTYRPLETTQSRLIAIGVIVGCWIVMRLLKRFRTYRASDRFLAAVVAQPQPAPVEPRPSAEALKLRQRFEEAVATIKQQRRSGLALYELPWYVIIGAPGSGKTTALLNSGLTFPLEQRVGKGSLRGVGGTRNCDWWFTDEAIFLDTAGRYTTQDSDAASDSAGWSEFLALLRQYRARRPVNGVILAISAQDLIVQGSAAREIHVEAARQRLDELHRELRIQLPVYLMVTKCDLVDGFAEYFDDLTAAGRAQVWGVTFPYEQTLSNDAPQAFPEEFDALMVRLNERVFARMEETRDPRRRTKAFAFPQQMATLRDALTHFVTDVFGSSQFDRQVLLRGVYFTSGTQEGTPIDRLLGSIGRTFGAGDVVLAPAGRGKAYFVEQLLKGVLIGESGLAGINRGLEARKAAAQLGAYAATGLVAASGVALMSVSYNRNHAYLQETASQVAAFERLPEVPATASLGSVLPRLDAIRAVVESSDRYRDSTSWAMSWGLYQGRSIGNAAREAYLRELDSVLLPRVAAHFATRIRQYGREPEKLFLYLRGYLMLGDPSHLDKADLQDLISLEWSAAGGQSGSDGPALSRHLKHLLDQNRKLRPIAQDEGLIMQARVNIPLRLMSKILYDGLKRNNADDKAQGLRIVDLAGLDVEKVFKRRSGVPLSTPVPRMYTREAFRSYVDTGQLALTKQIATDAWVWGENRAGLASAASVVSGVTTLYEEDYIRVWDDLLKDLEFVSFPTIAQLNEALRILASPTSPLRTLLAAVARETTLVETKAAAAAPKSVLEDAKQKIKGGIASVMKPLQDAAGLPIGEPGRRVTAHFSPVRQLLAGEADKTPLEGIIRGVADIQQQLDTLGREAAGADPVSILSSPNFRALTQALRLQSTTLPAGVRTVVGQIAGSSGDLVSAGATTQIEQFYEQQVVGPCRRLIANRYPFAPATQPDVQLTDFGDLFGHDGVFDRFFVDNLQILVDTSRTPWTWRPGSVTPSRRLLEQFQDAQRVRNLFFAAGSKTPELKFWVTLANRDLASTRFVLLIDGKHFDDSTPLKQPAVWPGPVPGSAASAFEARFFDPPKGYGGPWAWFRMIDTTQDGSPDAQQRVRLSVKDSYHQAQVVVEPSRTTSPFASREWRQFKCES